MSGRRSSRSSALSSPLTLLDQVAPIHRALNAAAALVGRSAAALMSVFAAIRTEDASRGPPDLTCLVVAVRTGLSRGMLAAAEQKCRSKDHSLFRLPR